MMVVVVVPTAPAAPFSQAHDRCCAKTGPRSAGGCGAAGRRPEAWPTAAERAHLLHSRQPGLPRAGAVVVVGVTDRSFFSFADFLAPEHSSCPFCSCYSPPHIELLRVS